MTREQPEGMPEENQSGLIRMIEEKEQQRQRIIAANKDATAPVLADLAKIGFNLEWVSDLYSRKLNYKSAIPVLLQWLPKIENLDVKEDIVRALSVPWARPIAGSYLVAEFHKLNTESNTGIKWAIANALAVVAGTDVLVDIIELVENPLHGQAREMLAVALGNINDPRAEDVLIGLLKDDEVAGHAIIALGKLKSKRAIPALEPFLNHPTTWVRKEAKKALAKIEKASK